MYQPTELANKKPINVYMGKYYATIGGAGHSVKEEDAEGLAKRFPKYLVLVETPPAAPKAEKQPKAPKTEEPQPETKIEETPA